LSAIPLEEAEVQRGARLLIGGIGLALLFGIVMYAVYAGR
jgi:hypothetical protein